MLTYIINELFHSTATPLFMMMGTVSIIGLWAGTHKRTMNKFVRSFLNYIK